MPGSVRNSVIYGESMVKKTICITGGSGFIGRNLVEQLSAKYYVLAPSSKTLDLTQFSKVERYFSERNTHTVIHCAHWGGKRETEVSPNQTEINLKMFANLLACKNLYRKMIYFGSGAEYGKQQDLRKVKESYLGTHIPKDSYGLYKYMCSRIVENEKKVVNLRLFGIYGKYEDYKTRFISYAICKALLHKKIVINQNVIFDYLYVKDLGKIVQYFIEHKNKYQSYNVGRGQEMDLKTIASQVNVTLGGAGIEVLKKGLNKEYTCDIGRLRKEIGNFEYTDFTEAIKELALYYQSILPSLKKEF